MAAANILDITVHGAGRHGQHPHTARHPVTDAGENARRAAEVLHGDDAFIGGSVRTPGTERTRGVGESGAAAARGKASGRGSD
ncbi:hypothetical protein SA11R_04725, partial [Rothia kristinae]